MSRSSQNALRALTAILTLALSTAVSVGCVPDKWKPGGWWWEGEPFPAAVQEVKVPATASVGEQVTVTAVVWIGRKRKVVEEATEVLEATRTVRIRLILRAYGDYSMSPMNIPLPVEKRYFVSFPAAGEWTVWVNETSAKITVLPAGS